MRELFEALVILMLQVNEEMKLVPLTVRLPELIEEAEMLVRVGLVALVR
jgi:hypothetical protein